MSNVIRSLVEETLETMEEGIFQDFCLDFLPVVNDRYSGLARFGHTAGGKTRSGTPDLLLTCADGSQIAVECGTEKNYWNCPQYIETWKPLIDARKCIKALIKLIEVVLIANREIPTNKPNTKAEIMGFLKPETKAVVTLVAREDIGQEISSNLSTPSIQRLLKKYFPEAFKAFQSEEEAQRFRIGKEVASERSVDSKTLFTLIENAFKASGDPQQAKQIIVDNIDSQNYRITPVPPFLGIRRNSVDVLPIKDCLGKVWNLIGVPKIGKTSLLLQLNDNWSEKNIHWYDCPPDENSGKAITHDLIQTVFPAVGPEMLLKSKFMLESALKETQNLTTPSIFVIDNAENISELGLRQIASILLIVKNHSVMEDLGIIFASNRNLSVLSSTTDHHILAPRWDSKELNNLLDQSGIEYDQSNGAKYLQYLEEFSGGHPLYAKALARKFPTTEELVIGQITTAPDPKDENLSKEAQELLYDDILIDADSQNLVQRLSILIGKTPTDILDVLRKEVSPPIVQAAQVIIDRVGGTVIEGSPLLGYSVPMVFRDVLKQKISESEKSEVYRTVGKKFLTPKEKAIDLERAASGIFYYLLANELNQVYSWTTFLVLNAYSCNLSDENLSVILDRLFFVNILRSPDEVIGQIGHGCMMVILASAHVKVEKYELALQNLEKIHFQPSPDVENSALTLTREIPIYSLILKINIYIQLNYKNVLATICNIDVNALFESQAELRSEYLKILSLAILRYPIAELSPEFIRKFFMKVSQSDFQGDKWAFDVAANIGLRVNREKLAINTLDQFFPDSVWGRLLRDIGRATILVELQSGKEAIIEIDQAINTTKSLNLTTQECLSHLYMAKGDAAYQIEDQQIAEKAYQTSLENSQTGSFNQAWSSWRLGLLKSDILLLDIAATNLHDLVGNEYWGRAMGARGVLLIKAGSHYKGVKCFHEIIDSYFKSNKETAGPAATIALANLSRLNSELEGIPIDPENQECPELNTRIYETVLKTARPRVGNLFAYYQLAKTYQLLKKVQDEHDSVIQALDIIPTNQDEIDSLPIVIGDFLTILSDPNRDRPLLKRCLQLAVKYKSLGGKYPLGFMAFCLFNKFDKDLQSNGGTEILTPLLELLEEVISESQSDSNFWNAELYLRKARVTKANTNNFNKQKVRHFYLKANDFSRKSNNSNVMIKSSHVLGFELATSANSLRELAEYQLCQLEGIEIQDAGANELIVLGENLFNLWSRHDWRRLLATDIRIKQFLMDCAKEMRKADTPIDVAAPAMILILARLFNHSGSSIEWAKSKCSNVVLPEATLDVLGGSAT